MYTEDLYRLLRAGHVQLQGILDTVSESVLVLDSALCVQAASRSFFSTFGVDPTDTIGKPIYEFGNGQWDIPELRRLLTDVIPRASVVIDYEVEHEFPSIGRKAMLVSARTLYRPDGASRTMLLSIADVTQSTRRGAEKDMRFGELLHRMKNLFGVTQAIARQMPVEGISAEEYRDAFLDRFKALVAAQDLAYSEQADVGLEQLLMGVLAPYMAGHGTVVVEPGEPVDLGPRRTMTLSMVLHELATNAVKYGALSAPGGELLIGWTVDAANAHLHLTWAESGGPRVTSPETTGYGTKMLRGAISHALGGRLEQTYAPEGFRAVIIVPLREDLSA